ncbi:hypothetical protein Glove_209g8 [Diversispora epigaea]|uniref:Protein kinase domain-containing protein n=1 Tax=Diversispora epigaea TaxID=1348612 RepID=A0A397ILC7_9GLOM|nr:hypothetical protein Glove_209g8 [Diversispora epigaea]
MSITENYEIKISNFGLSRTLMREEAMSNSYIAVLAVFEIQILNCAEIPQF